MKVRSGDMETPHFSKGRQFVSFPKVLETIRMRNMRSGIELCDNPFWYSNPMNILLVTVRQSQRESSKTRHWYMYCYLVKVVLVSGLEIEKRFRFPENKDASHKASPVNWEMKTICNDNHNCCPGTSGVRKVRENEMKYSDIPTRTSQQVRSSFSPKKKRLVLYKNLIPL